MVIDFYKFSLQAIDFYKSEDPEPEPDYYLIPLTFNVSSSGNIVPTVGNNASYEYKKNDGAGTSVSGSISVVQGDVVQFRGTCTQYEHIKFESSTCGFAISGNVMSIYDSANFTTKISLEYASCFENLFKGCIGLTSAENLKLPATTLTKYCYTSMFEGCSSLTTAPDLFADVLEEGSYGSMFKSCSSLNYIKCLATDISARYCVDSGVNGVSATGTFIKDTFAYSGTTGNDGIPSGGTVKKISKPIGQFTINSNGDQVAFSHGNLQCTIESGPDSTGYIYTGKDGQFNYNQYDALGSSDSANSFTVDKKMDLFGGVGESADYNSYGLVSLSSYDGQYYGDTVNESIKTDFGSIPGVISELGSGGRMLDGNEIHYILHTRTTGVTINGTNNARYGLASIMDDNDNLIINGVLIIPDNYAGGTPTGITGGNMNTISAANKTICTLAGFAELERNGVVFLPRAGFRQGTSAQQVKDLLVLMASNGAAAGYYHDIISYQNVLVDQNFDKYRGGSVRLVKDL